LELSGIELRENILLFEIELRPLAEDVQILEILQIFGNWGVYPYILEEDTIIASD